MYKVSGYYGADSNGHPAGLESSEEFEDWSKVTETAHEMLSRGDHVEIVNDETGKSIEINPDDYFESFEGEFPFKPQDLEEERHEVTREEAIQYALNQGTGIVNFTMDAVAVLETAETTRLEEEQAKRHGYEHPRYVDKETADWLYEGAKTDPVIYTAITTDMSLLDMDEWHALNEITNLPLSREDEYAINGILWENYDLSPMDIDTDKRFAGTIKEAFDMQEHTPALSVGDEARIFSILQKYEENSLGVSYGAKELADALEQFMFERGEYDFGESDRVRWLDGIPNAYELADNPEALQGARALVSNQIEISLTTDAEPLKDYLNGELAQVEDEDERTAKGLLTAIECLNAYPNSLEQSLNDLEAEEPILFAATADMIRSATVDEHLRFEATPDNIAILKQTFEIQPYYEYLEQKFGDEGVGVIAEGLEELISEGKVHYPEGEEPDFPPDIDISQSPDLDSAFGKYSELADNLCPMVAVDRDGDAALLPLFMVDKEDKSSFERYELISAKDFQDKIRGMIPEEVTVTVAGKELPHDYLEPPSYADLDITVDVVVTEYGQSLYANIREEAEKQITEFKQERDTQLAAEMIADAGFTLRENAIGKFDLLQDGLTVRESFDTLAQVITAVREAASEHTAFDTEKAELATSPDRLEAASAKNAALSFYPEDGEYTASRIRFMMRDSENSDSITIRGETYRLAQLPEVDDNGEPAWSYSSQYKIVLNEEDHTFTCVDTDEIEARLTERLSETLADFTTAFGVTIEPSGEYPHAYALFDDETENYITNAADIDDGKSYDSANEMIISMCSDVERVQFDLEEELENSGITVRNMPDSIEEWVAFAGRPENAEFVQSHDFEFRVMELYTFTEKADMARACTIQQEKEQARRKAAIEQNNKERPAKKPPER